MSLFLSALEVGNNVVSMYKMNRWCGEPLKLVVVPTGVFIRNKKGKDVMPTQISHAMCLKVQSIICT